jgi:hypothetical protein
MGDCGSLPAWPVRSFQNPGLREMPEMPEVPLENRDEALKQRDWIGKPPGRGDPGGGNIVGFRAQSLPTSEACHHLT